MRRISFELPDESATLARRFPLLRGVRAWCVSESRWLGLVGSDLARVTWRDGDNETCGVTAGSMTECVQHIDEMLGVFSGAIQWIKAQ